MIESSAAVIPWREAVKSAALVSKRAGAPCLDGPLVVGMVFAFSRPRSHFRTGRNAHLLREDAPVAPMGAPDLSKLARSTEDAITDAGLWVDDARVAEYCRLAKVWCGGGGENALCVPGVVVAAAPLAWRLEDGQVFFGDEFVRESLRRLASWDRAEAGHHGR